MISCFPCWMAISFFFCLLFFFQQKETRWKRWFHAFPAERQILFSFACFSFFSKKKPDEKDDSTLSLPNGKFFFLLPAFLFLARRIKWKREFHAFPAERQSLFSFAYFSFFSKKKSIEKEVTTLFLPNGSLFFLLPTFLFSAKRNQMKKMIPCFPWWMAISFFFCLLFFFQQKEK